MEAESSDRSSAAETLEANFLEASPLIYTLGVYTLCLSATGSELVYTHEFVWPARKANDYF